MDAASAALALLSTLTHAYWNYLVKRSGGGQEFVGLSKISEAVLFAPVFLALAGAHRLGNVDGVWTLIAVGAALTLTNYVMLSLAYQRENLTIVYPLSRAGILLFVPFLGYAVFGERLDRIGVAAIVIIIAGALTLQLPSLSREAIAGLFRRIKHGTGGLFALLAAAAAAGYTVWDKRAVTAIEPFTYFYGYSVLVGVAYGAYLLRTRGAATLRDEWRAHAGPIVQVGVLNTVTYLMVLWALRSSTSTYVVAIRQLSIAIGAVLGWRLLGEPMPHPRVIGISLLTLGSLLAAFAR